MSDKRAFLEELELDFDLDRIGNLTLFEKYKFIHLIRLIYQEAKFAEKEGVMHLNKSPNYTANKTYTLFAMLLVHGTKPDLFQEIIMNYARSFEKSDTNYAKISLIGVGLMMIEKGFSADAIFNYLMLLLGRDVLMKNKKYSGIPSSLDGLDMESVDEIEYKPFEGELRKLKYDMLALLDVSHSNGLDYTTDLINHIYGHEELVFFYNMMNIGTPEVRNVMYNELMLSESRHRRILIAGAYAILNRYDVFTTHYLFNSIIGKYSRYDKDSHEIEAEVQHRLKLIKEKERLEIM